MFAAARSAHLYKVAGDRSYPEEVVKCSLASIVVATGAVPPRVSSLALRLHSAAHSTETVSRPTSIISLSVYTRRPRAPPCVPPPPPPIPTRRHRQSETVATAFHSTRVHLPSGRVPAPAEHMLSSRSIGTRQTVPLSVSTLSISA